jgi:uncharacterized protein (TIGR00369 family)
VIAPTAIADGFAALLGVRPITVEPGHVVVDLEVDARMLAASGALHSGAIAAFAQAACELGIRTQFGRSAARIQTVELASHVFRPVHHGTLRAIARPVHTGAHTQEWEGVIFVVAPGARRVAAFRCTQLVLCGVSGVTAAPEAA